jgi:hypothetical protein
MTAASPSPVDTLIEAAKRLSRDEQVDFFDRFTEVFGDSEESESAALSPEWMAEVNRRIADDEAGLSEWTPAEDVLRALRASLKLPA